MMQTNVSIELRTQLEHARLLTFSKPPVMAPIKLTDDLFSIETRVMDNDGCEPMYNVKLNYRRKNKDKEQFNWYYQNGLVNAMLTARYLPVDSMLVTSDFKDIEKRYRTDFECVLEFIRTFTSN